MNCPNCGEPMRKGGIETPFSDAMLGGLVWIDDNVHRPKIFGNFLGEELEYTIVHDRYVDAYRCDSCKAVLIFYCGYPENSTKDNNRLQPLALDGTARELP